MRFCIFTFDHFTSRDQMLKGKFGHMKHEDSFVDTHEYCPRIISEQHWCRTINDDEKIRNSTEAIEKDLRDKCSAVAQLYNRSLEHFAGSYCVKINIHKQCWCILIFTQHVEMNLGFWQENIFSKTFLSRTTERFSPQALIFLKILIYGESVWLKIASILVCFMHSHISKYERKF